MSTLSLPDARIYAASSLYQLAHATGTSATDRENLLAYAAALPTEIGANLGKGHAVALACVLAAGENKAAAEVATLWCAACWLAWQKPGSVSSLELGQPPPPPPG